MTGHVLETAWHCLGCGRTIGKGERVHQRGDAWRCGRCTGGVQPAPAAATPKPEPAPPKPKPSPPVRPNLTPSPPGLPNFGAKEQRRTRYHKATTLEELLSER